MTMRPLTTLVLLLFAVTLNAATPALPPEKEAKAFVSDSLLAFTKAAQQKDFTQFHKDRLASVFREQIPLEKFTEAFKPLTEKSNDISGISGFDPVFDVPPAIDDKGVLVLKGHYDTQPSQVVFSLKAINESSTWKLVGIDV